MILEKIQNQYGEDIPSHSVSYNKGQWYIETLNCLSSQHIGLGTCRCVNHSTYDSRVISREEAKKIIGENIVNLSNEERENLLSISLEKRIEETFALKGFSIEQAERWCWDCFLLDQNPLPALRKILSYVNVEFAYSNGGMIPWQTEENKGIMYVMVHKPYGEIENVYFAIIPPKKGGVK